MEILEQSNKILEYESFFFYFLESFVKFDFEVVTMQIKRILNCFSREQ